MSVEPDSLLSCEQCGATIYPEHLKSHSAERLEGKLLCAHCLKEQKESPAGADDDQVVLAEDDDDKPRVVAGPSAKIQYVQSTISAEHGQARYERALLKDSPFATRCRTFHCKLTDASLGHLNEQINEWVDGREDVQIKFVTSNVGVIEGKHSDPHLIVTVFY